MCGPAGSGESTYARRLEAGGYTRLSLDEAAWAAGHRAQPLPEPVRLGLERDLRARLAELVRAGTDVVLDLSFWSRRMRDEYRDLLVPFGIAPDIVYLATPRDVALRRVAGREGASANDVQLDEETAALYYDHFEPPTSDEGPVTVVGATS